MSLSLDYVERLVRNERITFFIIGFSTATIIMTLLIVIAERAAKGVQP